MAGNNMPVNTLFVKYSTDCKKIMSISVRILLTGLTLAIHQLPMKC